MNTKMKLAIYGAIFTILLPLALTGCADNQVTVTKLGVSGQYTPFISTTIGGYSVGIQGKPDGVEIHYKDGDTTIDVKRPLIPEQTATLPPIDLTQTPVK